MNYNHNAKIEQVTEDTIVIGVDIGSESHTFLPADNMIFNRTEMEG